MPIFGDEGLIYIEEVAPSGYSRDFDSESTGAATNYSEGSGSGLLLTVDDTVYYGASGKSLKLSNNSTNISHAWKWDSSLESLSGDMILSAKTQLHNVNVSDGCRIGVAARCIDSSTDTTYVMMVRPQTGNTTLRIARISGSTETSLATTDLGYQITADTWYSLKFSLFGSELKGKFWLSTDVEPSTWAVSVTDATYDNTNTKVGVYMQDGTSSLRYGFLDSISVYQHEGYSSTDPDAFLAYEFEDSALDLSGSGNDGTLVGSASYSTGDVSGKWLDVSGGYVNIANSSSMDLNTAISVSAWVNPDATGGPRTIISKRSAWSSTGIPFELVIDGNEISARVIGNSPLTTSGASITSGTTYHVGMTWDGSTLRIYKNGLQVTSTGVSGTVTNNSTDVRVGILPDGTEAFSGSIDRVFVFNTAKSDTEMLGEYYTYA